MPLLFFAVSFHSFNTSLLLSFDRINSFSQTGAQDSHSSYYKFCILTNNVAVWQPEECKPFGLTNGAVCPVLGGGSLVQIDSPAKWNNLTDVHWGPELKVTNHKWQIKCIKPENDWPKVPLFVLKLIGWMHDIIVKLWTETPMVQLWMIPFAMICIEITYFPAVYITMTRVDITQSRSFYLFIFSLDNVPVSLQIFDSLICLILLCEYWTTFWSNHINLHLAAIWSD